MDGKSLNNFVSFLKFVIHITVRALWQFALGSKRKGSYVTVSNKYIILCVVPYRHWEGVETSWKPDDVDLQLQYCLWRHVNLPSQSHAVHTCLNAATSDVSVTWRHTICLYFDTQCNEESKVLSVGFIMTVAIRRAIICFLAKPLQWSQAHTIFYS
jgi:hypothetical protein